jgi:hypothetical protein
MATRATVVLLVTNAREFLLRRGFGEHVIDARFSSDGSGSQRVVTGDHDGANPQFAQLGETLANARFDHVLEVDRAKQFAVGADQQRRAAALGDLVDFPRQGRGQVRTFLAEELSSESTAPLR